MRIGLIAPPWIPVPPPAYGGTEEVIDNLARGLTALGHDVRLFTVGESTCPVPRQWLYRSPTEPMGDRFTGSGDPAQGLGVLHQLGLIGVLAVQPAEHAQYLAPEVADAG